MNILWLVNLLGQGKEHPYGWLGLERLLFLRRARNLGDGFTDRREDGSAIGGKAEMGQELADSDM